MLLSCPELTPHFYCKHDWSYTSWPISRDKHIANVSSVPILLCGNTYFETLSSQPQRIELMKGHYAERVMYFSLALKIKCSIVIFPNYIHTPLGAKYSKMNRRRTWNHIFRPLLQPAPQGFCLTVHLLSGRLCYDFKSRRGSLLLRMASFGSQLARMYEDRAARAASCRSYPTNPVKILDLQNPTYDVPELHKIPRSYNNQALKLWKGPLGS